MVMNLRGDEVLLWDSLATLPLAASLVDDTDGVASAATQYGIAVEARGGTVEIWRDDPLNLTLTKAELDLDTPSAALDTIVRAKVGGVAGNSITVAAVADSGAAENVTIEEVGNAVTIHFEDGVSTVADVEAAIAADSALIEVKTAGTGATVLAGADAFTATPLASGAAEADIAALLDFPLYLYGWNGNSWVLDEELDEADASAGRQRGLQYDAPNAGLYSRLALVATGGTVPDSATISATYTPIRD